MPQSETGEKKSRRTALLSGQLSFYRTDRHMSAHAVLAGSCPWTALCQRLPPKKVHRGHLFLNVNGGPMLPRTTAYSFGGGA
jgi:hypothetical protein